MTSPRGTAHVAHDRPRRVAFVGLGHMGSHMCRNVTTAGHDVTAYDLDRRAVRAAVRTGARGAKSLLECLEGAEVLVTKAGAGSLSVGATPLALKEAKPLPASD